MDNLIKNVMDVVLYRRACKCAGWVPDPEYIAHRISGMRLAGLPYSREWDRAAMLSARDGGAA